MFKIIFPFLVVALLITSCSSPLFAPPTPTATSTLVPSPTATLTPTPTLTLSPTATATPFVLMVHSREEFEKMVESGLIKCQGSSNGGNSAVIQFIQDATAAGVVPKTKYIL